jgi:rare lipoprotein A
MSSSARPIRGEVPLPEGRPYNLGSAQPEQAAMAPPAERTALARSRGSGQFQDEPRAAFYEPEYRYTRPVSAYAPTDPQGPSEFLAGRGLY